MLEISALNIIRKDSGWTLPKKVKGEILTISKLAGLHSVAMVALF